MNFTTQSSKSDSPTPVQREHFSFQFFKPLLTNYDNSTKLVAKIIDEVLEKKKKYCLI